MIHQLVPLIFVSLVVSAYAEPLRLRRQSSNSSETSLPLPCPIGCSWRLSHAWAKAISFDEPTPNMVSETMVGDQSDVFGIMCGLYREYQNCLGGCVAANSDNKLSLDASPPFDQTCTNKKPEFDVALPCLSNNTKIFRTACESDNEKLLAASVRLSGQRVADPTNIQEFCSSANRQLFCILPIVRQTCGEEPYNLIRSITNATLVSLRETVTDETIKALYPDCAKYFDTVANGIPALTTPAINITTPSTFVANATFAGNSTESNATTIDTRKRDDAAGPIYPDRASPRLQATTTPSPSHAHRSNLNNFLSFFAFSVFFLFSCH